MTFLCKTKINFSLRRFNKELLCQSAGMFVSHTLFYRHCNADIFVVHTVVCMYPTSYINQKSCQNRKNAVKSKVIRNLNDNWEDRDYIKL